jgi:hypothetical protein
MIPMRARVRARVALHRCLVLKQIVRPIFTTACLVAWLGGLHNAVHPCFLLAEILPCAPQVYPVKVLAGVRSPIAGQIRATDGRLSAKKIKSPDTFGCHLHESLQQPYTPFLQISLTGRCFLAIASRYTTNSQFSKHGLPITGQELRYVHPPLHLHSPFRIPLNESCNRQHWAEANPSQAS